MNAVKRIGVEAAAIAGAAFRNERAAAVASAAPGAAELGTAADAPRCVDVHTHVYLPRYMQMMRERSEVPRVVTVGGEDRLIILPGEDAELSTASGRPVGREYYDPAAKLSYMDANGIEAAVLSLANPWLDFLDAKEAPPMAALLNDDMEEQCQRSDGRFYGFGTLPTSSVEASCAELERIASMDRMRGIILSTHGLGEGLDDPRLVPIFETVERLGLTIFLHPHYGVGTEHFGGFGHALFLALGFTFETTVAVSRLILSGTMDKVPDLKLLLAHTGGTLPFLAGRLDSCYKHDPHLVGKLQHMPSDYLRRMYYDGISYHYPTLDCAAQMVGSDRIMFGTDHPFFPPPGVVSSRRASAPDMCEQALGCVRANEPSNVCANECRCPNSFARVCVACRRVTPSTRCRGRQRRPTSTSRQRPHLKLCAAFCARMPFAFSTWTSSTTPWQGAEAKPDARYRRPPAR